MKVRFATLAVLLLFCLGVLASTPETTIKVVVKNQYDKPVENAAVILDFLGSHQVMKLGKRKPIHWEVKTNQQGIAHFPPVPEGTVQLQVITKQYQTYGKKLDVEGDEKTLDITLNPPEKQYSAHPPLKPADAPKEP
ncbi:MAG: carboxypeptidase regulatory-like domain-containing protein [Acidobacteriaceae bacterium]|nr:carboxypeptidase regulatory-like domain-containing protein [Acidobacteriaceae bacterium]